MAVVRTEDLHDLVTAGIGAGDADGVHGRFGARVHEPPLRKLEVLRQDLGDGDRVFGRQRELGAKLTALLDRLDDHRVGMSLDHAPEAVVEVTELKPVDAEDARALAVGEVEGVRVARLIRGGDTHRHRLDRALIELVGLGGPLLEDLLFFLCELLDALAVRDALCHLRSTPCLTSAGRTLPDTSGADA